MELKPGMIVNLGAGMSEFVTSVAWEEGLNNYLTFVIEAGIIGGVPGSGLNFNTAKNPDAILDQGYVIDFFDGGGCDLTLLGFAQVDKEGNVNATKLAGKIYGVGGFLDVAMSSKKRLHCGTFTAGKQDIKVERGGLKIERDGNIAKFVEKVDQVSISGAYATQIAQSVVIVTERAVFEWTQGGLILKEIAPGVNLEEDILSKMAFKPLIAQDLREMPAEIFKDEPLGLVEKFVKHKL